MDLILAGLGEAAVRLVTGDPDVRAATTAALAVSGSATLLSIATGVPAGAWLGLARFRGRELVLSLVNTGMGLPPVVVGLFVAVLVWRSGPFGALDWYCTRQAMVVAQYLLAAPTVAGLTAIAIQSVDPMLRVQLAALGATRGQTLAILVREARLPILTAAMAGFGAVISEIGASLMVGCNIKGDTRILTTAIALDTSKGEFGSAFALAFILLLLVFAVNLVTTWAQQRHRPA
ncbi:MAG: tungstate transporter permease [Chloroflexi bacterium 13_1_40CM_3_70_6]|nr:MAG: tungstate transporter permease [Chloroflexi bacterium 13_1_40CM_3_70_6]